MLHFALAVRVSASQLHAAREPPREQSCAATQTPARQQVSHKCAYYARTIKLQRWWLRVLQEEQHQHRQPDKCGSEGESVTVLQGESESLRRGGKCVPLGKTNLFPAQRAKTPFIASLETGKAFACTCVCANEHAQNTRAGAHLWAWRGRCRAGR